MAQSTNFVDLKRILEQAPTCSPKRQQKPKPEQENWYVAAAQIKLQGIGPETDSTQVMDIGTENKQSVNHGSKSPSINMEYLEQLIQSDNGETDDEEDNQISSLV